MCSLKNVFLKTLENSQKNTCAGVCYYQSYRPKALNKRDSDASAFLCNLWNF